MKLSILDQTPIADGKNAKEALFESINLAKLGDSLGYRRYWIAEHHDLDGLACPAPEVMLGTIGMNTERIRIGAGAILLPHYKPFKVAETFNLLATMYPERVDLGLGRSPGGSAEASVALSGNFLENVRKIPELIDQLQQFLTGSFAEDHMYSKIKPTPIPAVSPEMWLLGTSEKSAILAAEKGMNYAFGHFMSDQDATPILSTYRESLISKHPSKDPKVILAVNVICAETSEEAEELAIRSYYWGKRKGEYSTPENDKKPAEDQKDYRRSQHKMIVGDPYQVSEKLMALQQTNKVDEFMILTNTPTYEERNRSYELLAKTFQ
ncbi:LLM class flavin-dependent oxidoreductase [Ornithinibacillus californiensis]|uniref:LLM class flavin-dependent oxidoreductase n=1 Tax=Ornithinibacillus californiensis TaxID=161536 RepID=UPI00064DFB5D|nr:LLM class flavin-dependent oxidoreductase [Ornithinibacillus californiensis]